MAFCLLTMVMAGCSETFSPDGPFSPRLVVYSVLSSQSDTQYVRVQSTFPDRNGLAPLDLIGAQVTVTSDSGTIQFRDTTLEFTDSSGTTRSVGAYVAYSLRVQPGGRYGLAVALSSLGSVSSSATGLYPGALFVETSSSNRIGVRIYPGQNARAHIARLFLEYETLEDSVFVRKRIEIPVNITPAGEYVYPKPVSHEVAEATFEAAGFDQVVARVRQAGAARLVRTVFVLTELDDALYGYYSVMNGFQDSGTLRLDEPDYTNINNGLGLFAVTSETMAVADTAGH